MISANLSAIFYLISGILFILALRGLSSPDTSRQGNYFGIAGMIIAIVVTFLSVGNFSTSLVYVVIFLLIGGAVGAFILVYFFNLFPFPEAKTKNCILKKCNFFINWWNHRSFYSLQNPNDCNARVGCRFS